MRAIILAAGQGVLMDGMVKCLIQAPHDGRPLLERMIEGFGHHRLTVVVGYRAVEIMQRYPDLHYVHNPDWAATGNAYSLALALDDEPCYALSSDLAFDLSLVEDMDAGPPNLALTQVRENRTSTSINCALQGGRIGEFYTGPLRSPSDPEAMGIYKVCDRTLLRQWKRACLQNPRRFAGQNLPLGHGPEVFAHDIGSRLFYEINGPADYLRALRLHHAPALA